MKIRAGFVSKSSSSSYVIVVPNSFEVDKISNEEIDKSYIRDYNEYVRADDSVDYDKVKKDLAKCIEQGSLWHEDNYAMFEVSTTLLSKYVISSIETGPEGGEISFIKQSSLERLLKKFNGESQ